MSRHLRRHVSLFGYYAIQHARVTTMFLIGCLQVNIQSYPYTVTIHSKHQHLSILFASFIHWLLIYIPVIFTERLYKSDFINEYRDGAHNAAIIGRACLYNVRIWRNI